MIQFICIVPFIPFLAAWVWWQERTILRNGWKLSELEQEWASRAGVAHPERIRIITVQRVPLPVPRWLSNLLEGSVGIGVGNPIGLCLRYGIYLDSDHVPNPHLLVHECVHTAQYETCGILRFLWHYLKQVSVHGYAASHFEQQANHVAKQVLVRS